MTTVDSGVDSNALWAKFKKYYLIEKNVGFALDVSRVNFNASFIEQMQEKLNSALNGMQALESGAIANPDEKRMVGHYWLRNSKLAPNSEIKNQIDQTLEKILSFSQKIHQEAKFKNLLLVGIGGSALGPQFVTQALGSAKDKMQIYFFDNTDPDGMHKVVEQIKTESSFDQTLTVVISKSGGTKETRNGQLVAKLAYKNAGLDFAKHFVAVTGEDSELDKTAKSEQWLERFPMWDWVGGRTSEFSAVGLLPAALQGYDIKTMLKGAADMDELTRRSDALRNPAALMALMWYQIGSAKGLKDMVVLPYKDRLELFSRYLQQLVMESLGKEKDLSGAVVNQGLAVYGNKGSTDQHAYVQQLRDGLNNFFAVFIEVLKAPSAGSNSDIFNFEVEAGVNCADYLSGFFQGTRKALYDSARQSITITIDQVSPHSVGMLVALFERAVGLYAQLINVNAYHQPGVEAGKKAASDILALQNKILNELAKSKQELSVEQIAKAINQNDNIESCFKILNYLVANGRVRQLGEGSVFDLKYAI